MDFELRELRLFRLKMFSGILNPYFISYINLILFPLGQVFGSPFLGLYR